MKGDSVNFNEIDLFPRLLSLLTGYGFGCFLTAEAVVHHLSGKSVRHFGTGNPGMANVMKIFGFKAGICVLAGDLVKTLAASFLCMRLFPQTGKILFLWAGLGAVIGHNWPVWRKFRGGKGVAVTCLAIFLYSPVCGLAADAAGMLVVFFTGYLPLGAVVITTLYTVLIFLFSGTEAGILALILNLIMISRHYPGLKRVVKGEEKRNAQLLGKKTT